MLARFLEEAQVTGQLDHPGIRWDGLDWLGEREVLGPGGEKRSVRRDSSPASVRLEVERSLERLGVECIDLVELHAHDPSTPVAETMGALRELRGEGKLRAIGVSNYPPVALEVARVALGDARLASDQPTACSRATSRVSRGAGWTP